MAQGLLAALAEAGGEAFGEPGEEDAALSGGEVVGDAMEDDLAGFGVIDGKGGAPIVVAGLADGAGVDKVAGPRWEGQGPAAGFVAGGELGAELVPVMVLLGEAALEVCVADEGDSGGHLLEWGPGVAHAEDVLVLVEGGAVGEG